jgi:2,3-bisphosphoglycerate-independent phosphoglycerate mutase
MKKNEEQKAFLESVRTNEAKLLEALPDWRDSTKRAAEQREIANHLIQLGYTPDELNELTDHRAVLVARKAMLWDRAQAVKAKQTQEAKNPPKVVKPGTANSPTNAKTQQIQQLAQKAKRSGRDDDVIALLMARSDRG